MAQKLFNKTERRLAHTLSGWVHPNCIARAVRAMKRSHRRLTRRQARQQLRASPVDF